MVNVGIVAASGVALLVATGLVVLAHRQTAATAARGYAICRGEVLARAQRQVRFLSYLSVVVVALAAGVINYAASRQESMQSRVAALELALAQAQAESEVAAVVTPAPAAPATRAEPVTAAEPMPTAATVAPGPPARAIKTVAPLPPRPAPVAVVRAAGGKLLLRDAPAGQVLGAVADGATVVVLDPKTTLVDGRSWTHVRATGRSKGQIQGWAASEFIAESQAIAQN